MLNLNFDETNAEKYARRGMPTEFSQCVVFYGTPIADELENYVPKKVPAKLRDELSKQKFVFPYYSQQIFTSPKDAELFLPNFIRMLIKDGKLPEDVVDSKGLVDDSRVKVAVAHLDVAYLEKESASEKDK